MAPDDMATDRRSRLRQYQVQLLARIQAAPGAGALRMQQLGLASGGQRYLIDLLDAGEIVPLAAVTPVPLTRPWYLGLANVRGNLVGVIDLARYLGGEALAPASGPAARLVTFAPSLGFNCALLVSRVYGLCQAGDMTPAGERLRDPDANEWTPLSLAALVRAERFAHIGL